MTSSMKLRIEVLYPTWRGRRYSHNNRKCLHKETLFIVVDGISFYVIVVANGEWVEEVARRLFVMQMCFCPFLKFRLNRSAHSQNFYIVPNYRLCLIKNVSSSNKFWKNALLCRI